MNNLTIKLRFKLVFSLLVSLLLFVNTSVDSYTNSSKFVWLHVIASGITLSALSTEIVDLVLELRAKREIEEGGGGEDA